MVLGGSDPHGAGREAVAGRVERRDRLAERVDRQHLRRRERVRADEQVELVDDRVREPDRVRPELVRLVAERVLLAQTGPRRQRQGRHLGRGQRRRRRRNQQRVGERVEDQRARRKRLDVERVRKSDGRGPEDAVGRRETTHLESGRHQHLAGAQADGGSTHRSGPEDVAPGDTAAARGLRARVHDFRHKTNLQLGRTMHAPGRVGCVMAGPPQSFRVLPKPSCGGTSCELRTHSIPVGAVQLPSTGTARRRLVGTPLIAAVVRATRTGDRLGSGPCQVRNHRYVRSFHSLRREEVCAEGEASHYPRSVHERAPKIGGLRLSVPRRSSVRTNPHP